jgi:hypothetical protein
MSPWIKGIRPQIPSTKLIVCGSRWLENYEFVEKRLNNITYFFDMIEVVLGSEGIRIERGGEWVYTGADYLGKLWAEKNWWDRTFFMAEWYKHKMKNKKNPAGVIRNKEMAKFVAPIGYCIAFWDMKSPGTKNMIEIFKEYNPPKHLRVIDISKLKRK